MTATPPDANEAQPMAGSERPHPIDVIVLTKNEEINLPHSLPALVDWSNVFVVDSGSTDHTRSVAESHGAEVFDRSWLGYAAQKNWALDNLPLHAPWTLIIDADEVVLPDLRGELLKVATGGRQTACAGFHINRYFIFLGQRIRHCGYYPSWNLRFFRRGLARYENREVHEHMNVQGETGFLDGHMEHHDRRGLEDYIAKHNRYSTLEARAIRDQRANEKGLPARFFGGPLERRRWIKRHIYPRLPAKWLARFVYAYVLQRGFLDGKAGLHFCLFLASYEHMITIKTLELAAEGGVQAGRVTASAATK